MLGGLGNSVLNPSENYGLHNEDMYFRELTPQNQQRIDQIRQHVQHHKTQKNELLSTWSPDELVQREEDFRSFETRILNLGVEQKKDATLVSQLTTTTYKDINHVIEAKETVRRIAATKGHGAQGYSISGSPLTTFFREMLAQYQHEMVSCTSRLEELKHLLDGPAASSQPPLEVLQEVMQNQYKYLWSVAGDVKRKLDKAEEEEQRFVELVAQLCPDKREQVQRMLEDASQAHQNNLISNTETASVKIRKCEQLRMSGHRGAQDQQASQGLLTSGNSLTGAAPAAVGGQGSLLTPAAGQLGVPGAPAAPAGGLFGTPAAAPAGGLFGAAAPAAPAGGLFGAAAPAGGLFGAAAPAGGLFGAPSPGTDKKKNTKKR